MKSEYRAYTARWIVPIAAPPIAHGVLIVDADKIIDVGERSLLQVYGLTPVDLGEVIIFPGFVNCHVHLEHAATDDMPQSFARYQQRLLYKRLNRDQTAEENIVAQNIAEIERSGIVALADFTFSGASYQALLATQLFARVFFEVNGFKSYQADALMHSYTEKMKEANTEKRVTRHLTPATVWSVSPELMRSIALVERHIAVHMNCDETEEEFLRTGGGFIRQLLHAGDDFDYGWEVPACSPLEYFFQNHFCARHNLLVHMNTTTADEMELMREAGVKVNICLCPRAGERLAARQAPAQLFLEKGFNLCVGTEGRLLVPDFDLRKELRLLVEQYGIAPENALKFATLNGAYAIGFHKEVGSLEPGKTARCLVVACSGDAQSDPFEGIIYSTQPLRWLTQKESVES